MPYQTAEELKSGKTLTTIIYALYAASFIVGITWFVAIIINYVKRDDVVGAYLESHFRWQIRTFWFSMLWATVGFVLSFIGIGFFILIADGLWVLYRIVKGWLYLNDSKEMYQV